MLFVVTHSHTADRCPAFQERKVLIKFLNDLSEKTAEKLGVKIVGSYTCGPEHRQFMVLETDDYVSLSSFLAPLEIGETRITPVTTVKARREQVVGKASSSP